ncbi:hypothetical protein [Prescottella subtropica]|uniref:hypothetical protein n=1 Tax=Prescottella subtropica TaxID=2545757 RepID=UPI0010F5E7A2|nr:hypothetical protein [Prescottella subtropica]
MGTRWVSGSFTFPDCSEDDNGLDASIGDAIARLGAVGVHADAGDRVPVNLDAQLAALVAGVFRPDADRGMCGHARERGGAELCVVFDGSGPASDAQTVSAALSELAEIGVHGQVECVEIGTEGPTFTRWSVDGGLVNVDAGGRVVYTG